VSVESKLLISVLKLSKKGVVKQKDVNSDARIPASISSTLIAKLQDENLINLQGDIIETSVGSRLAMAFKAVTLGADLERISDLLSWQEFEEFAALNLKEHGYETAKNVHFKHAGKRWEIDVVGCKKPLVICIDCKQWHHGMNSSTIKKMVESQTSRVHEFAECLPCSSIKLQCTKWEKADFVPVILSLIPVYSKFSDHVPVVSVLQIREFIDQLPLNLLSLKRFHREYSHL
jgi:Holliday junction resolvase-like predicted endonuclease